MPVTILQISDFVIYKMCQSGFSCLGITRRPFCNMFVAIVKELLRAWRHTSVIYWLLSTMLLYYYMCKEHVNRLSVGDFVCLFLFGVFVWCFFFCGGGHLYFVSHSVLVKTYIRVARLEPKLDQILFKWDKSGIRKSGIYPICQQSGQVLIPIWATD